MKRRLIKYTACRHIIIMCALFSPEIVQAVAVKGLTHCGRKRQTVGGKEHNIKGTVQRVADVLSGWIPDC